MVMKSLFAAGAMVAGLVAGPAIAHHATSTFYLEDPVGKSGAIQEVIWANPHGIVVFQDDNGDYWIGEMSAVVDLAAQGLSPEMIEVGTEAEFMVLPSREGTNRVHIEEITVDDETIYTTLD